MLQVMIAASNVFSMRFNQSRVPKHTKCVNDVIMYLVVSYVEV